MDSRTAIERLRDWDNQGRYVFSVHLLRQIFRDDSDKAFNKGLARLVAGGLLERACRGVYINPHARSFDGYPIEHVAIALRPRDYNYVSLESALSEYGALSQIPTGTLTVMTTGVKGRIKTSVGIIEFTHSERPRAEVIKSIVRIPKRPLRVATERTAWRDLLRVRGRERAAQLGVVPSWAEPGQGSGLAAGNGNH